MNAFTFPYDLLNMGTVAVSTYFGTWRQFWEDRRLKQEAELQKVLIEGLVSEEVRPERIPPRIHRIAAAARTFLNQNQLMTLLSITDPVTRRIELGMLRRFVHGAQLAEHAARQSIVPHVPLSEWTAPGSYRDELALLAGRNPAIYLIVMEMPALLPHNRQPIAQQLCGALMDEHAQHQME